MTTSEVKEGKSEAALVLMMWCVHCNSSLPCCVDPLAWERLHWLILLQDMLVTMLLR